MCNLRYILESRTVKDAKCSNWTQWQRLQRDGRIPSADMQSEGDSKANQAAYHSRILPTPSRIIFIFSFYLLINIL
jgi:hypothetical protein